MSAITYVPLPNELVVQLITRYQDHYDGFLEHAVESFLERTSDDYNSQFDMKAGSGYIWSQLVLPESTELRTNYKRKWEVATVKSGRFDYNGKLYDSPSKVCNAMRGGTSNNAWITLEIKRPQDVSFRMANSFRRK